MINPSHARLRGSRRSLVRTAPLALTMAVTVAGTTMASPARVVRADALPLSCATAPLAQANPYGAFVLKDATLVNSDIEGPLAVGGNASLAGFNVGGSLRVPVAGITGLPQGQNGAFAVLAVGGNVTATDGSVAESLQYDADPLTAQGRPWNAFYGGTATLNRTVGSFVHQAMSPVDFAGAARALPALAQFYGSLPATPVTRQGGYIGVAGQAGLDVFSVSGADLSKTGLFAVKAPSNATVLINVTGPTASIANANFASLSGGIDAQHVLFNFPDATSLSLVNAGISGSILAPKASLSSLNNETTGAVIISTLLPPSAAGATGQINLVWSDATPFIGCLPTLSISPGGPGQGSQTPELDSIDLVAVGVVALGAAAYRRRRATR